ncbi:3-deoxy-7-phosphoheptulonate synthase [Puniceicoccales bacterium CK1056]|uniref:Phospho-2-dehydro-3-deoxyheptonate aldolase n=1 Tax=Oceanipulchritudo coccoides TaxID=2706888 RepID=A0A6B2M4Q6_9BACT|nr:3-deoxy-7-phosphoheptulonate synthase [Oceanipulchritudo coccoides]NDV63074.1 3-deoxy-7-phosphoheptulonate synthase [Oceanipulchritudo coccoides]
MSSTARQVSDVNILDSAVLPAPEYLCRELPRSAETANFVASAREAIHKILFGDDQRLLVIVGPCSIHDPEAGLEYARKLVKLKEELQDRLYIVMRVYFEKPRTTVGWKGLIMDPDLDGSCNLPKGLKTARQFLNDVLSLNLATATELLDPITPQYISDLICWSAVGARTTESQTHRQMASGLSMPLGFKNATSGDTTVAINAIRAASQSQTFLGISHQGLASALTTRGNPNCHLILRGGNGLTNYDEKSIHSATEALQKNGLLPCIMVDCSHDNSGKDPNKQPDVMQSVTRQAVQPESPIMGVMLESNLIGGNQAFPRPLDELTYGQSITDGCVGWDATEETLRKTYAALKERF